MVYAIENNSSLEYVSMLRFKTFKDFDTYLGHFLDDAAVCTVQLPAVSQLVKLAIKMGGWHQVHWRKGDSLPNLDFAETIMFKAG